jgi:rhodanese-related sulfurtransferase
MTEPIVPTISRDHLLKKMIDRRDPFVLVETLPAEMFQHTHLPGAINLPPRQLAALAPTALPDKNADIVVYCASPT